MCYTDVEVGESDMLTEQRVEELIELASKYAISKNLDVDIYIHGLINPDTIGNHDAGVIIETLIRYHTEWLKN